jgi:hypothetical protein
MDLTTKENVKKLLSIDPSDTKNDVVILSLVKAVSAQIEKHLCRSIFIKERTDFFDVEAGQKVIDVDAYPVTACKAYNDVSRLFTSEIDQYSYTYLGDNGQIIFDKYNLSSGAKVLKIVYTGGLAASQADLEANFPDLEMATRIQTAFVFQRKNKLSVSAESVDGHSVTHQEKLALLPFVVESLDNYQRKLYV